MEHGWNPPLIWAPRFGADAWERNPPTTLGLLECASDLKPGEILEPDGAESKQRHHQSIPDAACACEPVVPELGGFNCERQTRLHQPVREYEAVEFRPRLHDQGEVLLDLGKPRELLCPCH